VYRFCSELVKATRDVVSTFPLALSELPFSLLNNNNFPRPLLPIRKVSETSPEAGFIQIDILIRHDIDMRDAGDYKSASARPLVPLIQSPLEVWTYISQQFLLSCVIIVCISIDIKFNIDIE
jgi:hypothetical protein